MSKAFSGDKWTIQPHGDGFALYSGRGATTHGLNLFNIKETDKNFEQVAALIVIAPEMYELLEDCMIHIFNECANDDGKKLINKIIEIRRKGAVK